MIMEKMSDNLFYNLRHLKTFKRLSNNENNVWAYRWPDGKEIEVYDKKTKQTLFTVGGDVHFAEYLCSLHNASNILIKEVESKYVR